MANTNDREQWHSRPAFIMAAIGSAVGLGNVWRFPYVAYDSGGGAFLIPYFMALFTAGIPMLILEMGLGQRMQRGAPLAFGGIRKPLQWFGWWAAGLSAGIVIYYSTILAWSWVYLWHSFDLGWGSNPEEFFNQAVLHKSAGPGEIGWPVLSLVIGMALTWLAIYLKLPMLNSLFGIIFFVTLLTLGIDSAFALQEAFTTGFYDKWKVPTKKLAGIFVLVAFPVSLIFVTRGGFYWFDIVDKWICDFGLVISGLIQCIVVGYLYKVEDFRSYLNTNSEVRLGNWWVLALRYVTPAVLTVILIVNLYTEITEGYENYPRWATLIGGWGVVLFWAVLGYYLWKRPSKSDVLKGD